MAQEVKDDPVLFQEAKEYLRGIPGAGASVYDHLTQVLVKILNERPSDANTLFEEVSSAVRDGTVEEEAKLPTEEQLEAKCDVGAGLARSKVLQWARDRTQLFTPPGPESATVSYPDLMDEANSWQWGGVSFGDVTTYLLQLSLKRLAIEKKLQCRFWGKIATRNGDYFIVQSLTKVNPSSSREARMIMEGTEGPNKYTYFVSKEPGGSWTQLPYVTAKQLEVAQKVRRFFSGDLNATVSCYPPLPPSPAVVAPPPPPVVEGEEEEAKSPVVEESVVEAPVQPTVATEANLLSAMIALITADTTLAFAGFYDAETEEAEGGGEFNVLKPSEGPAAVALDGLKDPNTFVHCELDISVVGRTQATPYPLNADGDPIGEPEEPDPEPQVPLRSITEDTRPLSQSETVLLSDLGLDTKPLWQMKDDATIMKPSGPSTEETGPKSESNQSFAVLKSLKWPGAVSIAKEGKNVVNVYVGHGIVSSCMRPKEYEPPLPAKVEVEWKDPDAEEDADPTKGMIEEEDKIFEPKADADEE